MKTAFVSAALVAANVIATPFASASSGGGPLYLNQVKKSVEADEAEKLQLKRERAKETVKAVEAQASSKKRGPAGAAPMQKSEAAEPTGPAGTQISFFEISPSIGSLSIGGKSTFTIGSNVSFKVARNFPAYFEPSIYLSFLNGLNDQNGTLWHIDGGLRFDFAIDDSAVVPFIKGAIGPTLASNSSMTFQNGEKVPDSYLNAFLGGGVKVLVSQHFAPRLDVGTTLQNSSFGLYLMGSAVLPL